MDQVSGSFETQQPAFPFWGTSGCPVSAMPDDPPVDVPPVKGGYPLEAPPLPAPEPEKPPVDTKDPKGGFPVLGGD